ncbi:MAG: AmmeMemoRadiSam system radical SAM enzyme [Candidatus Omnitrophica bacterium]|nr:AmmeMemoRadiSam system radical SAM enzyme [Candidatus Omnitrophota bacterium]
MFEIGGLLTEALFYEKLETRKVRCRLCPTECLIAEGHRGACGVRVNKGGILYSEVYGRITSASLDPIEKKPLYRYHPGEYIYSIGAKGCNLHCDFCQNWQISQSPDARLEDITPEEVISRAKSLKSFGIAYTYNEPFIWYEFVLECAKLARKNNLENVLVTNGYVNIKPLEEMLPYIGAMNIDLKAFNKKFYTKICAGRLESVLDVIKRAGKSCHIELTTLVIPGLNDSEKEIRDEAQWICDNAGPETPLHLSRYFPCYKMKLPPTPLETLERAREIAMESLKYVYLGNV